MQSPLPSLDASEPQNLLARIFRFKPEAKYLALRTSRDEALAWMYALLEAYSYRGLRDIRYNSRFEIGVTVDKNNSKRALNRTLDSPSILTTTTAYGIRPCKFVVEGFQILTDGHDFNQLCVIRFTQKTGAASSMRKVVREVNKAVKYQQDAWLIKSRKEARKICDCVKLA